MGRHPPEGREWWLALQRERRSASPYGGSSQASPQELAAPLVFSLELAADLGSGDCPELVGPADRAVADGADARLSPAVAVSGAAASSPAPPAAGAGPLARRRSSVLQTAQQLLQRLSTQAPAGGAGSARGTPRRAGVTEAGRQLAARSELFSKADHAAAAWRQMQQAQREALRAAPGGGRLAPLDEGSACASPSAGGSRPSAGDSSRNLLRLESTADLYKLSLADFSDAEVRQHLEGLLQEERRRQRRRGGGAAADAGAAAAAPADQLLRAFLITRTPPEIPVRGAPAPPSRTACRLVAAQEMQRYHAQQRRREGCHFRWLGLTTQQAGTRPSGGATLVVPSDGPAQAAPHKTLRGAVRRSVMLSVLGGMARSSAAAVWAREHAEAATAAAAAALERRQAAAAAEAEAGAEAARLASEGDESDGSVQQVQSDVDGEAGGAASAGLLGQPRQGQRLHGIGTGGVVAGMGRPAAVPAIPMQQLAHKQQQGAANARGSGAGGSLPLNSERQRQQRQKQELAGRWAALQPRLPAATEAAPVVLPARS